MGRRDRKRRVALPAAAEDSESESDHTQVQTQPSLAESGTDDSDDNQNSQMRPPKSTKTPKRPKNKVSKPSAAADRESLSMEKMVKDGVLYIMLMQHKKLPLKKSDFVKHVMNGQYRDYPEFILVLEKALDDVFGIQLIPVSLDNGNATFNLSQMMTQSQDVNVRGSSSSMMVTPCSSSAYCMVVSKFRNWATTLVTIVDEPARNTDKQGLLFLFLTCIFMYGGSVSEDKLWYIYERMEFAKVFDCTKREDFRKFLKAEFVKPCYLAAEISRGANNEGDLVASYSWGIRAVLEFNKTTILKFVTKCFPGKSMVDFPEQYNEINHAQIVGDVASDNEDTILAAARNENDDNDSTICNGTQADEEISTPLPSTSTRKEKTTSFMPRSPNRSLVRNRRTLCISSDEE